MTSVAPETKALPLGAAKSPHEDTRDTRAADGGSHFDSRTTAEEDSQGADLLLSLAETATAVRAAATEGSDFGRNNPVTPSPPTMGNVETIVDNSLSSASPVSNARTVSDSSIVQHQARTAGLPASECGNNFTGTTATSFFTNDDRQVVMSLHSVKHKLYASPITVTSNRRSINGGHGEGGQGSEGTSSPPDFLNRVYEGSGNRNGKRSREFSDEESSAAVCLARNVRVKLENVKEVDSPGSAAPDKLVRNRIISPSSSNECQKHVEDERKTTKLDDEAGSDRLRREEKPEAQNTLPATPYQHSSLNSHHYHPHGAGYPGPPYAFHNMYHRPYYATHPHPMYYHHPMANGNYPMATPSPMYPGHPPHPVYMYPPYAPAPVAPEAASAPATNPSVVRPATAISATKVKAPTQKQSDLGSKPPSPAQQAPLSTDEASEWQHAPTYTVAADGGPPSTNRCVQRKHLFPPSNWQDQLADADIIKVPDFHRLVNYPAYLTRGRNSVPAAGGGGGSQQLANTDLIGKKHCVMCGKLRVCSTSSTAGGTRSSSRPTSKRGSSSTGEEETSHIIPRQNKGVCTACDVAVWVVLDNSGSSNAALEIKWCKGCKNFRPWPCFGEKVLATKCVRCRDRQREKYAAQKVVHGRLQPQQQQHYQRDVAHIADREEKKDDNDLLAANGLRTLMHASES